jgi:uncharacterized protein YlxW (UPF0749 family)
MMDDDERDEILYRLDERTERVDETMNRLENRVAQNEDRISKVEDRVNSNTQYLHTAKGLLAALGTGLMAVIAKVLGLIKL